MNAHVIDSAPDCTAGRRHRKRGGAAGAKAARPSQCSGGKQESAPQKRQNHLTQPSKFSDGLFSFPILRPAGRAEYQAEVRTFSQMKAFSPALGQQRPVRPDSDFPQLAITGHVHLGSSCPSCQRDRLLRNCADHGSRTDQKLPRIRRSKPKRCAVPSLAVPGQRFRA